MVCYVNSRRPNENENDEERVDYSKRDKEDQDSLSIERQPKITKNSTNEANKNNQESWDGNVLQATSKGWVEQEADESTTQTKSN